MVLHNRVAGIEHQLKKEGQGPIAVSSRLWADEKRQRENRLPKRWCSKPEGRCKCRLPQCPAPIPAWATNNTLHRLFLFAMPAFAFALLLRLFAVAYSVGSGPGSCCSELPFLCKVFWQFPFATAQTKLGSTTR